MWCQHVVCIWICMMVNEHAVCVWIFMTINEHAVCVWIGMTINEHAACVLCSSDVPTLLAYRLRGMQFTNWAYFSCMFGIIAVQMKSINLLWNPEIRLKSRTPLWNPEIRLKSRTPLWNPEIHSEIGNPHEIQWISKSHTPGRAVADPSVETIGFKVAKSLPACINARENQKQECRLEGPYAILCYCVPL